MFYETASNNHGLPLDPFKAVVAPRPVGWISTASHSGVNNLAPYSFFNAFAEHPHYVGFGSGGRKDSLVNVEQSGVFAVNMATLELRDAMNASSAEAPLAVDEFQLAGLTPVPCTLIAAPRVRESPACLECRHHATIPLPGDDGKIADYLVLGRVIGIHIDDRFIAEGRVQTAAMKLIARLGYSEYATVETAWRMRRPG